MGTFLDKLTKRIKKNLDNNTSYNHETTIKTTQELISKVKKKIQETALKDGINGIPSGITKIDNLTGGWQPSDLIIIGGRPGMGKTAFSLTVARHIAINKNIPTAFFSLESTSLQVMTRLMSIKSRISSQKLKTGKLKKCEWKHFKKKANGIKKSPLYIDDTPSLSITDLIRKSRLLKAQHDIKLIIIDHLQLMTLSNFKAENREQEMFIITKHLKTLAKELNIPIIALSQLSSELELRGGCGRPKFSDLYYPESIELYADIVGLIYRPEYYRIYEWDDEEHSPTEGTAEFIIARHRNGGIDNIRIQFIENLSKFDNLENFMAPFEFHSKMTTNNNKDTFNSVCDCRTNPCQYFKNPYNNEFDEDVPF